jgi:hypothetical protein
MTNHTNPNGALCPTQQLCLCADDPAQLVFDIPPAMATVSGVALRPSKHPQQSEDHTDEHPNIIPETATPILPVRTPEPINFGPGMVVIAFHQGEAAGKSIDFRFDVDAKVMDLITSWKQRDTNL